MRTIHKAAVAAAVVASAAVVGVGVIHYTSNQDPPVSVAGGDLAAATQDAESTELRSALEDSATLNEDAQVGIDLSLPEALSAGMIGGAPDGVTLDPPHCLAYLSNAIEDESAAAGWVQMGVRPMAEGQFSALVATVPGGVSPESLIAGLEGCEKGTIVLESIGVEGTFTFQVLEGPKIEGAETLTVYSRTSFPDDVSDEELASTLSCTAELGTVVTEASRDTCSEPEEVSAQEVSAARKVMQFYSMEYYFTYAMSGDLLAESCEVEQQRAEEVAADLFHNALTKST